MKRSDLLTIRDLLEEKTGLYLPVEKLDRLEELFRDPGGALATTDPLKVTLAIAAGSAEGRAYLNAMVAALATNETYFFRVATHFEILKSYLLPELLPAKSLQGKKSLKIWSAGCSTGEEPYSLAIVLLQTVPDIHAWEVTLLATDIDLDALQSAREGIYRPWSFRGVEPEIINKYFHPIKGELYRLNDRIRSLVNFRPLNLKSDPYPSPLNGTTDLDIILCRNVTIYFRPQTTQEVVRRFHGCLMEGGFLLTGATEYSHEIYRDFEARVFPETVVYQKPLSQKRAPWLKPAPPLLPLGESPRSPAVEAESDRAQQNNGERRHLDEALDLISQGEVDQALVLLAIEAEKSPQDSGVWFLLGQISADRHHLPEAFYWLSRTLALDPLHLWAHYLLALLWIEEGRMDAALQSLKKTIYIDPNFALGHFYLGRIYKDQRQSEKARKSFATAKSLLGSSSLSQTLRGAKGMTTQQLLSLVDRELNYEG